MARRATLGQLLINEALPEDLRDYQRVLDKGGLTKLLRDLAEKHPDKYRETLHTLTGLAREAASATGGHSFGLEHLRMAKSAKEARKKFQVEFNAILNDDSLSDDEREKRILAATGRMGEGQADAIYKESLEEDNPLAWQVLSGSRGNKQNLAALRGSDLLYTDHHDRVIPVPIIHSYSQGLTPLEYWAGAYGARRGVLATKFAVRDAGYLAKQLSQSAHRAVVTELDDEDDNGESVRGLPVDINDDESEGALLAAAAGPYARNTVLTPKILRDLRGRGLSRILVRSPAVGGPRDGGVFARDVGVRERGGLPARGEQVGLTAAQALSEPLSQAQLAAKHSGGVAGADKALGGFEYINQLVQVPESFRGGAAHAETDGSVERIEDAPAGGKFVTIGTEKHYVPIDSPLKVKVGQWVEAGDVISDGIPNPATIVRHKGVGEGRRYFVDAFRKAFVSAGLKAHRRNIELLSKGLINHVRLTQEFGDYVPDDVVPYSAIERDYRPRDGASKVNPAAAIGRYLERPYLHYTIGTKVRPSMLKDFNEFGVKEVETHSEPPPFEPEMQRGMANLQYDQDWMTQMYGSGLKGSLLHSAQRGASSDETGTSFVPGLAKSVDFGTIGKVQTPQSQTWTKAALRTDAVDTFDTPQPPKPPQPPVAAKAPSTSATSNAPNGVSRSANLSHQMVGEGFVKGMGGLLAQNPMMQTSKMRDAWSTLTTRTGNTPAAPLTASQRSPGIVSLAGNQVNRAGYALQGAMGAGSGLLGWAAGRAGQAIAGKGGFWQSLGDSSKKQTEMGLNQVSGNVAGSLADVGRWTHSVGTGLVRQFASPETAQAAENHYKSWWGDKPGSGWADGFERYQSGGSTHSEVNPLANHNLRQIDVKSRIANYNPAGANEGNPYVNHNPNYAKAWENHPGGVPADLPPTEGQQRAGMSKNLGYRPPSLADRFESNAYTVFAHPSYGFTAIPRALTPGGAFFRGARAAPAALTLGQRALGVGKNLGTQAAVGAFGDDSYDYR